MELGIADGRLPPAEMYPSKNHSAQVHSCCWEVAWNVLGRPPIKHPFLNDFARHLIFLKPFAERTPFDCETNDVDHELWAETPCDARIELGDGQDTHGIFSSSLFQEAFLWLDQNPGIIRIDDVQKMDKFLAFCVIKGIPYSLATDKSTNVRPHLQRALQSFKSSDASRLPKTSNLWVAWNNVKSALDALQSSPLPQPLRLNPDLCGLTTITKYCVPAVKCHRLIFSFKSYPDSDPGSRPTLGLVGFIYDGKLVGSGLGRHTFALRVRTLKGIHIVHSRAGGITAVRVRDGQRWSAWFGAPESGTNDSEHEWDNPRKDLIFSYDVRLLESYFFFLWLTTSDDIRETLTTMILIPRSGKGRCEGLTYTQMRTASSG